MEMSVTGGGGEVGVGEEVVDGGVADPRGADIRDKGYKIC